MDEILRQLGTLVLGSLPTMMLFLVLVLFYQFLVAGPLGRTLAARRERTSGAIAKAHAAVTAADEKTRDYETRLRAARSEIFRKREQRIQQWNQERDQALAAARDEAQARVRAARTSLEMEAQQAKAQIEAGSAQLVEQVLAAVLPQGAAR